MSQEIRETHKFDHIRRLPRVIHNVHESCYRGYQILEQVKTLLDWGTDVRLIRDMIDFMEAEPAYTKAGTATSTPTDTAARAGTE